MKNNKSKNTVAIGLIYVILLGVFNLLVFTIFKERNNVFWTSYTFMTIAFVVQIVSMFLSFKSADVETAFFGIPLASFSVFYLIAAIVIGAVFMIFQQANVVLAAVIQVLVLAAFLIVAILSLISRDAVVQISENVKTKVVDHKSTLVDIEMIRESCTDPELKELLRRLCETVKYSDPMTNEAVADVEQRIKMKISELRMSVYDNQIDFAKRTCADLERLYIERNRKLATSK